MNPDEEISIDDISSDNEDLNEEDDSSGYDSDTRRRFISQTMKYKNVIKDDTIQSTIDTIHSNFRNRFDLPDNFFDDYTSYIPRYVNDSNDKWQSIYIRKTLRRINSYLMKVMHDQYELLNAIIELDKLYDEKIDRSDKRDYIDDNYIDIVEWDIQMNSTYNEYMESINLKLKELSWFLDRSDLRYSDIPYYLDVYPKFNWKLKYSNWFDSFNDYEYTSLLNFIRSINDQLRSL